MQNSILLDKKMIRGIIDAVTLSAFKDHLPVEYLDKKLPSSDEGVIKANIDWFRNTAPSLKEAPDDVIREVLLEKYKKVDDEDNKKEILDLLDVEEKPKKYLDLGEFDNEFYYGFTLEKRPAILTSSGKIYRNTLVETEKGSFGKDEISEKFEYIGEIGEIAPVIKNETIKRYYGKKERNNLINPVELYQEIRDKILYYMDFSGKDEIADVLTCWIIGTYCYPLFYWFPHILFNAPSGSGKSKGKNVTLSLSFRGFDLGASAGTTPATIYRTIEGNRGTIGLDEFEQKNHDIASDTQLLINQLLNASASKDAYIIRNESIGKSWKPKKFPIYCPKITCNISGINPTSLSRYISFSWLKTNSIKGKRKPERPKDKASFDPLREDLYILILENHKKIKEIYENLELNLNNRDEDNWLPLFAIAKFIDSFKNDGVIESQLNKYLTDYKALQIESENETADFFRILYEIVNHFEEFYQASDIAENNEIMDLFHYLKSPAHKVGKLLKQYKFPDNKRAGGKKKYLLSKSNVQKIIDLYFSSDIITHNNTNNTDTHKQHIITQKNDEKDENRVLLCGLCDYNQVGSCDKCHQKEGFIIDNEKKICEDCYRRQSDKEKHPL